MNDQLQYAVIENADEAVVVSAPPAGSVPKVVLQQCIVNNSYDAGILGLDGSIAGGELPDQQLRAEHGVGWRRLLSISVSVRLRLIPIPIIAHTQPVLAVADEIAGWTAVFTGPVQASFVNCIFWGNYGNVPNEVVVSQQTSNYFSVGFSNCLWKVQNRRRM